MGGRGSNFGRVAAMVRDNALSWSRSQVGSTQYAKNTELGQWKKGSWKCNAFVIRAFNTNVIPQVIGEKSNSKTFGLTRTQYRAVDFHEGKVPGFSRVSDPQAGDIATDGKHVGIVSGKNKTISATEGKVVENDWGFREGKEYRYYRYYGGKADKQ